MKEFHPAKPARLLTLIGLSAVLLSAMAADQRPKDVKKGNGCSRLTPRSAYERMNADPGKQKGLL